MKTVCETYDINPVMFEVKNGYCAVIEGVEIKIIPHSYEYKLGANSNGEVVSLPVLKSSGCLLVNGVQTRSGKFENLTDRQLYELVTAQVIILTPAQDIEFRKKFFNISS